MCIRDRTCTVKKDVCTTHQIRCASNVSIRTLFECVKHTKYAVCTSHLSIECRAHLTVYARHTTHAFCIMHFWCSRHTLYWSSAITHAVDTYMHICSSNINNWINNTIKVITQSMTLYKPHNVHKANNKQLTLRHQMLCQNIFPFPCISPINYRFKPVWCLGRDKLHFNSH